MHIKYVWDHDAERAARRAKEVDAQVPADLNAIWSDPEISAVIILSETNRHYDLVLAAAKAGKNMFVEKPLGITAKQSDEMAAAIDKAGLIFTTGYFSRTDPKNIFLKNEVAAGHFGKISRVRASNCHNGSLGGWFDGEWRWMADPKIAGVGAFGDLGTHKLDILMWLFGGIESVTADIHPVTGRYGDCDETGEALLQFKSGIIGTLAAGWVDIEDPVTMHDQRHAGPRRDHQRPVVLPERTGGRQRQPQAVDGAAARAARTDGSISGCRRRCEERTAGHAGRSRRARRRHAGDLRSRPRTQVGQGCLSLRVECRGRREESEIFWLQFDFFS